MREKVNRDDKEGNYKDNALWEKIKSKRRKKALQAQKKLEKKPERVYIN